MGLMRHMRRMRIKRQNDTIIRPISRICPIRLSHPFRPHDKLTDTHRHLLLRLPEAPATTQSGFIPPHGGYRELLSYRKSEVAFDLTVRFCQRFLKKGDRTIDQMVQAARSGKQNIAEGSQASGTSKETELKLTNVARSSMEELLVDYQDFLRVRDLRLWEKNSSEAQFVRDLGKQPGATYETFREFCES